MSSIEGDRPEVVGPPQFGEGSAPTEQLVSGVVAERCVNCGAPMSADQRYCINCGERRGTARFTTTRVGATTAAEPSSGAAPPGRSAGRTSSGAPRWGSAATILSGLVALLLALGIGVLIGHDASSKNGKQNVTVTYKGGAAVAGAAAPAAASTTAASSATTPASSARHHGGGAKGKSASAGKTGGSSRSGGGNAASKVVGSKNLPPETVTQGATGHGPGYSKKGKFNGSFFGQ